MAQRVCVDDGCNRPFFGRGYCYKHYYRYIRKPKREVRMAQCAWCGERKPISLMRHPDSSRGKTPASCHACREAHPDQAWCTFHNEPHPKDQFTPVADRPIGVNPTCVQAATVSNSRKLQLPVRTCITCQQEKETWQFRGGSVKCPNCRDCEAANAGQHWCVDCAAWLDEQRFVQYGRGGKYWTVRCKPCRTANAHGVTVQFVLERQGSSSPECACCGSTDFLKIDHDHTCCPTSRGCKNCVRGYLCHECNASEGLLRTAERARLLADYMERWSVA